MTNIQKQTIPKLLPLLTLMIMFATITLILPEASAFNLNEESKTQILHKTIIISTDGGGDCYAVGQWNKYSQVCIVNNKTTVGLNDVVVIQSDVNLEIPHSAILVNHGIIKNDGLITVHGHVINYGQINNYKIVNNDGEIENYWGTIRNSEGALIVNGGHMLDKKYYLRLFGKIDNHYGAIHNNGIISNYSTIDNHWGQILNNCLGSVVGYGYLLGNDIKNMDCLVTVDIDRIQ